MRFYTARAAGDEKRSYLPPLSCRFTQPRRVLGTMLADLMPGRVEPPFLLRLFRNEFRFSSSFQVLFQLVLNRNWERCVLCFSSGRSRDRLTRWLLLNFLRLGILLLSFQFATPLDDSIGDFGTQQADGTNGIIIGRDRVINLIRIAVCISKSDDGDFEASSLYYGGACPPRIHSADLHLRKPATLYATPGPLPQCMLIP